MTFTATASNAIPVDLNPSVTAATLTLLQALRAALESLERIRELDPSEYRSTCRHDGTFQELISFADEIEEDLECFECLTGNLIPVHLLPEWFQD